jgi:hypothetical protein
MNTTAKKLATKNVSPWVNNVSKMILPQKIRQPLPHAAAAPMRAFDEPPARQEMFNLSFR